MRAILSRIPFLLKAKRVLSNYRWLRKARRLNTYAQNGEDVAVLSLFPEHYKGTYIDLGANHPYRISNTYLLYTNGWRGVCVDPMPMFEPKYRRIRPRDIFLNVGVGARAGSFEFFEMSVNELSTFSREIAEELVEKKRAQVVAVHKIQTKTLPEIVALLVPDGTFDVLSIDVEGLDAETVRSTDWASVKPRVVICETSSYDHDWSGQIIASFSDLGFRHYQHIGCNDVFINTAVGRTPEDV
jgi:FkbM family methyltransferase